MRNKNTSLAMFIALIFTFLIPLSVSAQAPDDREGRFRLGTDLGVIFGTPDEEAVGINAYGDYFFSQNMSVGPLLQIGFTSDLFMIGPSVQLKYTHDFDSRWKAHLQGGLGFMYANLDRSGGDQDDTGFLLPIGGGIEYKFTDRFSVGTTVLMNFMDLDKVRNENFSLSFLGGIKFRF